MIPFYYINYLTFSLLECFKIYYAIFLISEFLEQSKNFLNIVYKN